MRRPLLFFGLLAACTPSVPLNPVGPDTCNRAKLEAFVGEHLSATETTLLLQPVRVLRPNQAPTLEFLAERLNIVVDTQEIIARLYCG